MKKRNPRKLKRSREERKVRVRLCFHLTIVGTDEEEKEPGLERLADKLFGDKLHYVTTDTEVAKKLRTLGHIPVMDGVRSIFVLLGLRC